MNKTIEVQGPYFEDYVIGEYLPAPPAITVHEGYAAIHQALFGDRLRLPLDANLTKTVTGKERALVNPSLLCNAAIGQTTYASQQVKANLFYRGLIIQRPVYLGDTLYTTTKPVALKQNTIKPGRAATGMVALEMQVKNQHGEEVIKFWRCPMIPCRNPEADTGHNDNFDAMPAELDMDAVKAAVPQDWQLDVYRKHIGGEHGDAVAVGNHYIVKSRDTVTLAPELVRMTLNMAITHTDAQYSAYKKRLVYGGHTIAMCAAQLVRAFPNMLTILAWRSCDHTGPVFENDILRTEVSVVEKHSLANGGQLLDLHAIVYAERGDQAPEPGVDIPVLDWKLIVLMA